MIPKTETNTSTTDGLLPRARWRVRRPAPAELEAAHPNPIVRNVLAHRGITEIAAARAFLEPRSGDVDPFRLAGMHAAVDRIRAAIREREPIVVFGDYDADGVTGAALLTQTLRALGADADAHIPHRERDGYGLSIPALEEIASRGTKLVVTVDCGVRAVEEVAHANSLGLDIVITDHHVPPDELPAAVALINPRRPDDTYGFQDFAGVGMAYKLAQALIMVHERMEGSPGIEPGDLLDLVALGTVADVVSLRGENRELVTRGLDVLRQARRPGIRALCQVAGLTASEITAQDIGFGIAPRINAAGRMGDARDALDLLLCEDLGRAADLAAGLEAHNRARRAATDVAVEAAELSIGSKPGWFVHHISPDVALGVVGLVAGQLSRKYARPSIVLRQQGEWARGSLRSIPGFDVVAALDSASELLERYGGHAQAGGLTVRADRLPNLIEHLNRHAETVLSQRDLTPVLDIDSEVPIERIDWALQGALSSLEPCGEGNRKARLLVRNARVLSARIVGSNHLKLSLAGPSGPLGAIAFRQGEKRPNDGTMIDVVFSLGVDTWRGKSKLSLTVEDLATSGAPIEFESEMSS